MHKIKVIRKDMPSEIVQADGLYVSNGFVCFYNEHWLPRPERTWPERLLGFRPLVLPPRREVHTLIAADAIHTIKVETA